MQRADICDGGRISLDEAQIKLIIRRIDFKTIRNVLRLLPNWPKPWNPCPGERKIPSIDELKSAARESLRNIDDGNVHGEFGGGFCTEVYEGRLDVHFSCDDLCPQLALWNDII